MNDRGTRGGSWFALSRRRMSSKLAWYAVAPAALDNILKTNETRLRLSNGLCKMRERPPDLERLKRIARESYADWWKFQP
jgi:hypothetical protein